MITKAGFGDAWERTKLGRRAHGLTCCHLSDLSNNTSTFDQRIDFIFIRTIGLRRPLKRYPGLMALDVIGDEPQDRTVPNQLWPSDHGGLVADFYGSPTWFRRLRQVHSSPLPPSLEWGWRGGPRFSLPWLPLPCRLDSEG